MKESLLPQCYCEYPMSGPPNQILLVTPVWNDAARLAEFGATLATALAASPLAVRWVIADDGSRAGEHARLTELKNAFALVFAGVELHFAAHHRGKGAVVREAWALAPGAAWLAFVDADGSVTAAGMLDLIALAVAAEAAAPSTQPSTEYSPPRRTMLATPSIRSRKRGDVSTSGRKSLPRSLASANGR